MNVIFDAGGVLFYIAEFRNDIFRRVLSSIGYSNELIEEGLKGVKQFDEDYFSSNQLVSWDDEKKWLQARANCIAKIIDGGNEVLADKLFMLAFDSFQYKLYDETRATLDKMKTDHKLYVLSNATASLDWAFDYLDLRRYFESIVISSYVEVNKPDKRIYEYALEVIGDNVENCVFVDDRIENVEAGLNCGIKSFHLDRKSGMSLRDFEYYVSSLANQLEYK